MAVRSSAEIVSFRAFVPKGIEVIPSSEEGDCLMQKKNQNKTRGGGNLGDTNMKIMTREVF